MMREACDTTLTPVMVLWNVEGARNDLKKQMPGSAD